MIAVDRHDIELRILAITPSIKDGELTQSVLERAGISCHRCLALSELITELKVGAGAILLPEEVATNERDAPLAEWLNNQPPWSDLPVLILARPGADSTTVAHAMDLLGNVTVLERPMRVASLVSTARSALRARLRQYQIRDDLLERNRIERELRAADRHKDEFLAILAHELRNPLAPIRHALDILKLRGSLDHSSEELRAIIERQVNHMVRIVDDLLEVSRISTGKIELRKEVCYVADVIDSAIETSLPIINGKNHTLNVMLPAVPIRVIGDPVRLAQIFSNLLTNAAKYTDPNGTITIEVSANDAWFDVKVIDNGTGISSEMLPQVFEMFAQIDRNAKRSQGGLGIGLNLVRSLTEMHGGSIQASSDGLGQGCRFIVRLPQDLSVEKSSSDETPQEVHVNHRFLVVDDNRDAAAILGHLLELFGAEVKIAHNGTQALTIIQDYNPSAAILDIGMPDMSGHELARRIREMPQHQNIRLIALSGWGQGDDRRKSKESGFDDHLVKPVDIEVLQNLLRSL